ncbi:MAG: hypothetical protein C4538_04525 [Nitrospiraceae bacterium]|nr:MAG: hypothetical protein C4538_04525 [Nitrospiraceae bacterium]
MYRIMKARIQEITELITEMRKAIPDKQRKPIIEILYELIKYNIVYNDFPKYYFKHLLHRKYEKNYLDYYIGKKEFFKIRHSAKDKELVSFLENKVLFQHHLKESNLRLPNYFGYNLGNTFFSPYGTRSIHNSGCFSRMIEDLMKESGASSFFVKPISGIGGRDCFKIDTDILGSERLEEIYNKIISAKYIFQETIVQHPLISAIYPHSVNTLRIHTGIFLDGNIDLISITMKFGSDGKYVEAGGLGTILISVDKDTGRLGPQAWKNFEWGGDKYIRHPDTGFEFSGFIVPYFEAAKDMAKAAAAFLPYRLVGWDVAISETGPVLIEGNHNFGFWGAQIGAGGYRKNKVFRTFYEELNSLQE